jgi:hypothetical protein
MIDYEINNDVECPVCLHSPLHNRGCPDNCDSNPNCQKCKGTNTEWWCPNCGEKLSGRMKECGFMDDDEVLPAVIPLRIQRSRKTKQISPNGLPIVYVGRPGKFGNPFSIFYKTGFWVVKDKSTDTQMKTPDKECAVNISVRLYKDYIQAKLKFGFDLSELKGKNLSCWCPIGQKCHADILLSLANSSA